MILKTTLTRNFKWENVAREKEDLSEASEHMPVYFIP